MKRSNNELNSILDKVTSAIQSEQVDPTLMAKAAERVRARLSDERAAEQTPAAAPADHIRGCEDFQTLIPSYLNGSLSAARTLLFEDHTRECVPCRKALKQARTGSSSVSPARPDSQRLATARPVWVKWAVAATLIIGLGAISYPWLDRFARSVETVYGTVSAMNGAVYMVSDTATVPANQAEKLQVGERIRTAKDAGAVVRLADGSLIEMRERSEFSISDSPRGITIHLERGNIIVQAAKQRSRHLYVATNDALVSVTGTIFSVNNGTKGSRVSVIEGEVHVDHAGEKTVLHPGGQVSTSQSIESIPVNEEIAWSRDRERYTKLLTELAALGKELDARVSRPAVRYSTRLLDLLPERTVFYVALPNLTETLAESQRIVQERIEQNPALREWWDSEQASSKKQGLNQVINRVREFGSYLGNEIVISAEMGSGGDPEGPLVLAELSNASGFRSYLEQQLQLLNAVSKKAPAVRLVDDPLAAVAQSSDQKGSGQKGSDEFFIWIRDDVFAGATNLAALQQLAANMKTPAANRFTASSFHSRIAEVYRDGAGLLVAADLEKIISQSIAKDLKPAHKKEQGAFKQLGISSLKHFVLELKEKQGKPHNSAVVSFSDAETGIASWLAAPGPMGALEFISPDANAVGAFVVKEPTALVDNLLGALKTADPAVWQHLKDVEAQHGIDIRRDLAEPLGGEFAFAIDGPVLPSPSWKIVCEVYDPAHLQQTFERLVEKLNEWASANNQSGLQWERTEIGGRTFYTLKSVALGLEVNYAYANGYLIAAPSRALVDRALKYRESGYTLLQSPRFIATLPEDKQANFSAFFYHNLGSVLAPLARTMGGSSEGESGDKKRALSMAANAGPALAYVYSLGDRMVLSVSGENGPIGLNPSTLLGLGGPFGLEHIFEDVVR